MKKLFILISFCFSIQLLSAQQSITTNLYSQNPFLFNPAATGSQYSLDAFLNHCSQGTDVEGAPQTIVFGAQGMVGKNVGLGGMVLSNSQGIFENLQALVAYSYKIQLGEKQSLSFGVSAGGQKFHIKAASLNVQNTSDLNLNGDLYKQTSIFAGFGLNYKVSGLNVNLSAPQLYNSANGDLLQVMAANLSYDILLAEKSFLIQPSVFAKMEKNNPLMLDGNLIIAYKQFVWLQAGYRHTRGFMGGAGVGIGGIGIGYAYGYNTGVLAELISASHEITLTFRKVKKTIKE